MENPEKQAHKPKMMGVELRFIATDQTLIFILQLHVLASYGPDFVFPSFKLREYLIISIVVRKRYCE